MCTLTVINLRTDEGKLGYRLVMNRDELRTRSRAMPPEWRELDGVRAIWPVDPDGGGTWIGAAETGLTLALVNSFPEPMPKRPSDPISRGLIIPRLIASEGIEGVVDAFESIEVERYAPFRLVAVDLAEGGEGVEPRIAVVDWNREELAIETHLDGPICLVSSGLGDSVVEPRLGLYEDMLVSAGLSVANQDRFHAHEWGDRPDLSVMLNRELARTVSVTTVECLVDADEPIRMDYREVPE